ncbi:hypothetical protein RUM43_006336 [Polyplax serrata]|uniref:Uncharacterized protein n=1 Tax=Polyplax serrata TaxID=468196 RepID=A0AAN8NXN4_POLSC
MAEENKEIPEGSVLRDDGCICPGPPKPPTCGKRMICPYDPRYPNQNQTGRCFMSFVDYQRCVRLLGDYPGCFYFLRCYEDLCPLAWIETWYEQLDKGTFPRKIYPPKPVIHPPNPPCYPLVSDETPPPTC